MILDAALAYAKRKLPVFPVRGKLPLTEHGFHDASTDADTIRGWWSRFPNANVALPTGSVSRLVVLDVDPRHGGRESLAVLEAKHGTLPATLQSQTGGGGRHFFFALAEGQSIRSSTGKLGPGLDVRGDGGYVVIPPSVHPETKAPYRWASKAQPAPTPPWLVENQSAAVGTSKSGSDAPIPAGRRNETLAQIAGAMRRRGCTQGSIEAALLAENARRCSPALSENEVRAIARSVSRYTPDSPRSTKSDRPETGAILRCFRDIGPEPIRWLWPGRIPLGKLTLLVGDPGLGKSLATVDIAARVSRGISFPGGASCEPATVLMASAEDDPADTIRPRLDAARADVNRVHTLEGMRITLSDNSTAERPFDLEAGIATLEDALARIAAVRLIIIDPISAYLGHADSNVNAEVRGLLSPLVALAARHAVAVLCVTHLRKSAGAAVHRAIASIAFTAAARAVWAVASDPANAERRLMLPVKQNLAANVGGLAFRIEEQGGVPHIEWESQAINLDANDVLNIEDREDHSERSEAEEWVREYLADGPVAASEVKRAANAVGIKTTTLWRAARRIGVAKHKLGGRGAGWEWSLEGPPGKESTPPYKNVDSLTSSANQSEKQTLIGADKPNNSKNPGSRGAESLPLEDDDEVRL